MLKQLVKMSINRNVRLKNSCATKVYLFDFMKRNYCDIKTNVELLFSSNQQTTIPSQYHIKKTIKNLNGYDLNDGHACIRTKCPVCVSPPIQNIADRCDIYVNKTSGN